MMNFKRSLLVFSLATSLGGFAFTTVAAPTTPTAAVAPEANAERTLYFHLPWFKALPSEKDPEERNADIESMTLFNEVLNAVKKRYVDKVDDETLYTNALMGLLDNLDPHSMYLDIKGWKDLQESTQGSFGGLGIEIAKDPAGVLVNAPIDDTPAQRAGIRSGDIIVRIDGKSMSGVSLNRAVKLMRGKPGTKIKLTIARKGEANPLTFELTRATIRVQSVKFHPLPDHLGYIRISQFQERTVDDLVKALKSLDKDGNLKGLVLDLRTDPGGLLPAAVGVVGAFTAPDTEVVSTRGRNEDDGYHYRVRPRDYTTRHDSGDVLGSVPAAAKTVPLVVLMNASSASASEIVAGALQDHKRATIMGDRSFGKGSVQVLLPFELKGEPVGIKITTARYYTPSGRSIQARGIEPDYYVDDTPKGNFPSFQVRESDLNRHLKNPTKAMTEEEEEAFLAQMPFDGDENDKDPKYEFKFGDEKDWQLQQAQNFLLDKPVEVSKYRGKPRQEVERMKAEEADKAEAEAKEKAKMKATTEGASEKDAPKPADANTSTEPHGTPSDPQEKAHETSTKP